VLAVLLSLGCAIRSPDPGVPLAPIQVFSRSHNRSDVDGYLLCGDRDAEWLGVVSEKGASAFEIAAERARCLQGRNFFLVVQRSGRGYCVQRYCPEPEKPHRYLEYTPGTPLYIRTGAPPWVPNLLDQQYLSGIGARGGRHHRARTSLTAN
jgi:hypothetical protein